eukprot:g22350.t1
MGGDDPREVQSPAERIISRAAYTARSLVRLLGIGLMVTVLVIAVMNWPPWVIESSDTRVQPAPESFAALFTPRYEVVSRVPLMRTKVTLTSDLKGRYGTAMLEVLRLVPRTAVSALQAAAGEMLRRAVEAGVEGKDMEQLIFGIRELGPDTISSREASHALETAARMGLRPVVELLLSAGAHATLLAARNAERAENGAEMARDARNKTQLLARAIEERMPLVADRLLADGLGKLETLSPEPDGLWARKAHCAGAWSVLTALLERGDQMPCKPRLLLDYALRAGCLGERFAGLLILDAQGGG